MARNLVRASSQYLTNGSTPLPSNGIPLTMAAWFKTTNLTDSQVLMAHDVCSKHRLKQYGGHGFDHIATRIVPRMRARGISEEDIRMVMVDNPTRMLTFS